MKKRSLIWIIVLAIVLVWAGIYFSSLGENSKALSNCGVQGQTINFANPLTPNECCEDLDDVNTQDSVSVSDECYWDGKESGSPVSTCSDCGNGICEDVESVCGCSEDCVGKGKSDFNTVQEFCDEGYDEYCEGLEGTGIELCELC
jgi:hypothetical protein